MKKVIVKNYTKHSREVIPDKVSNIHEYEGEELSVSDGYHTFDELYDHRITLYIALCRLISQRQNSGIPLVWRTPIHYDGTNWDGWFMLAIGKEKGTQISYHLPMSRWDETNFADTFHQAPYEFDGHTSDDVIERLKLI